MTDRMHNLSETASGALCLFVGSIQIYEMWVYPWKAIALLCFILI